MTDQSAPEPPGAGALSTDAANGEVKRPAESEDARNGLDNVDIDEPAAKRIKVTGDASGSVNGSADSNPRTKVKGTAMIKPEYLIKTSDLESEGRAAKFEIDDDAAEANTSRDLGGDTRDKRGKKARSKGMNTERDFGRFSDTIRLCASRAFSPEFSPRECRYGDRCNQCHDLRKYLREGRRSDLELYDGKCPNFEKFGRCPSGWRCLFHSSHMKEIEHEDGRKELVLIEEPGRGTQINDDDDDDKMPGIANIVSPKTKQDLQRKRVDFSKSDQYLKWLDTHADGVRKFHNSRKESDLKDDTLEDERPTFVDPPFKPSEKRKIYFGRETPVLAPLTTQGNIPFRRLCIELGAQATYSEMGVALHLLQGQRGEWALMKAHESELSPPRYAGGPAAAGYDNTRDLKFGAQITGNAPWQVIKATQALATYLPHLRLVDINCGCPIDMVFKQGAGSALLDSPGKLERMIRGMNAVSGEIPATAKLRLGVKDGKPTAQKLIERLAFGGFESRAQLGAPGCAAVTLHGRSRQQRYKSAANWSYIAECATMIKSYEKTKDELTDTVREPDGSTLANSIDGKMYFLGNGDCYSHVDYFDHLDNAKVDSVMIARGALVKPWIFEEIEKGQYLDKSATERLAYVEKFARYGMETWGSDELGIGFTRRFLLEYLSFTHRYIPVGIMDYLPPALNDRPPAFRCRNELETLLASDNYKDWIKITDMFLGPAPATFKFQPKHKSNAYEVEAEG